MWSVRTLQRNVSSQYYYRVLKTQKKDLVEKEMKEQTAGFQQDRLEFIKNPIIAEFSFLQIQIIQKVILKKVFFLTYRNF